MACRIFDLCGEVFSYSMGTLQLRHAGSTFLTKDAMQASCAGSIQGTGDYKALDCHGSPYLLKKKKKTKEKLSIDGCKKSILENNVSCTLIINFGIFFLTLFFIPRSTGRLSSQVVLEHTHQCRRHKRGGFNPWVWKIPWMRA